MVECRVLAALDRLWVWVLLPAASAALALLPACSDMDAPTSCTQAPMHRTLTSLMASGRVMRGLRALGCGRMKVGRGRPPRVRMPPAASWPGAEGGG